MAQETRQENLRLWDLLNAIISGDEGRAAKVLLAAPVLARQAVDAGATREEAPDFYFKEIEHYLYSGDTPLHAAAAGYRNGIARALIGHGAEVAAVNRRGAEPLHYAADGGPGLHTWNPQAQGEMIRLLIRAGANPNALDKSGVAPLHRAVRKRCTGAVDALLRNGAQVRLKNKSGSTPLHLAVQSTGSGGSGTPESKACQKEVIQLLVKNGADPRDRDGRGRTAAQCALGDWMLALL